MPSYPTSVFNPAARSNGQTIDASHVNGVQDELNAVTNALLGTITHSVNISGASTLATLQAAASTFSVRPVTPPPAAVKVALASSVTLGSSAESTITWATQEFITNSSMHSVGTNPERLIPQSTGIYECIAAVNFSQNSTGFRGVRVIDSSGTIVSQMRVNASTSEQMMLQTVALKRFDVLGGYVVVTTLSSGASTLSLELGAAGTWASLHKL